MCHLYHLFSICQLIQILELWLFNKINPEFKRVCRHRHLSKKIPIFLVKYINQFLPYFKLFSLSPFKPQNFDYQIWDQWFGWGINGIKLLTSIISGSTYATLNILLCLPRYYTGCFMNRGTTKYGTFSTSRATNKQKSM